LKRSNRLIVLVGIILAVLVAGGVFILTQGNGGGGGGGGGTATQAPTTVSVLVASQDMPLGTVVAASSMTTTKNVDVTSAPIGYFTNPLDVNGLVIRKDVHTGDVLVEDDFNGNGLATSVEIEKNLKAGFRAMTVQVDQVTGVGTLIQAGDYVDVVLSMENSDNKFPVDVEGAPTREGNPLTTIRHFATINGILNATSVKVLVQNVQVLGTLLPPPTASNNQAAQASPGTQANAGTALNGQQEIVVLALTPQQVELVRFTQLDGNLSLVLRSTADQTAPPDITSGITLRMLVDKYGILVPRIIVGIQP
jgi:Flp pilus assembly protein CpaB